MRSKKEALPKWEREIIEAAKNYVKDESVGNADRLKCVMKKHEQYLVSERYKKQCHICGGQGEHTSDCGATMFIDLRPDEEGICPECKKPETKEYEPCCSLQCWMKKYC